MTPLAVSEVFETLRHLEVPCPSFLNVAMVIESEDGHHWHDAGDVWYSELARQNYIITLRVSTYREQIYRRFTAVIKVSAFLKI